jgi:hypothetical protein
VSFRATAKLSNSSVADKPLRKKEGKNDPAHID